MKFSRNLIPCGVSALAMFLFIGCSKSEQLSTFDETSANQTVGDHDHDHDHDHEHVHAAPHGGTLIELGEHEYNAEAVIDEENNKLSLYLLGAHAESAQPVTQSEIKLKLTVDGEPAEYTLTPAPEASDPEGMASKFEIVSEELIETLEKHEGIKATFEVSIDNKSYTGTFQHDEHAHDDHAHGEHGHEEGHSHGDKKE